MKWLYYCLLAVGIFGEMFIATTSKARGIGHTVLLLVPAAALVGVVAWLAEAPLPIIAALVCIPFVFATDGTRGWSWLHLIALLGPVTVMFGLPWLWQARGEDLLKRGLPASATVLEAQDLNWNIGVDPVLALRLQVSPPEGASYETKTVQVVSRLSMAYYQAGMTVKVRIDPEKPQRVAVESIQSVHLP